ncbi:MAG: hypothetical protein ACM3TR_10275, partial [Caulobacteraceae bacterium]
MQIIHQRAQLYSNIQKGVKILILNKIKQIFPFKVLISVIIFICNNGFCIDIQYFIKKINFYKVWVVKIPVLKQIK